MAKRGTTLSSKTEGSKHSPKTAKRLAIKRTTIARKLARNKFKNK
jgi:hypothetical protein